MSKEELFTILDMIFNIAEDEEMETEK